MKRAPKTHNRDLRAQLKEVISQTTSPYLPSLVKLARQFRVRTQAMADAVHVLASEGILETGPGKQCIIKARKGAILRERQSHKSSFERICETLAEDITSARLKAGAVLPKAAINAKKLGVSPVSVLKAYHQLTSKGMIHKAGRRWFIGQPLAPFVRAHVASAPFLALIMNKPSSWASLHEPRTQNFCTSFMAEVRNSFVRIKPIIVGDVPDRWASVCTAPSALQSVIANDSGSYMGALVIDDLDRLPSWELCFKGLLHAGQPVVWFDRYDKGFGTSPERPMGVVRCHFSERNAIKEALSHLSMAGHRHIGYPSTAQITLPQWTINRLLLAREIAANMQPSMSIWAPATPTVLFKNLSLEKRHAIIADIFHNGQADLRSSLHDIVRHFYRPHDDKSIAESIDQLLIRASEELGNSPQSAQINSTMTYIHQISSIIQCLREGQATALLMPSDTIAQNYLSTIARFGLTMPRDISLLSFDNHPLAMAYSMSTVDFGFGHIGYCAFHVIARDLPIKVGKNGDIAAAPVVLDRGSVGNLRTHNLPVDLNGSVWDMSTIRQ